MKTSRFACCRWVCVATHGSVRDGGTTIWSDHSRSQARRQRAHRVRGADGGAYGVVGGGPPPGGTGDRTALRAPAVDVHEARDRVDDFDNKRARLQRGRRRRGGGIRGEGGKGAETAGDGTERARRV